MRFDSASTLLDQAFFMRYSYVLNCKGNEWCVMFGLEINGKMRSTLLEQSRWMIYGKQTYSFEAAAATTDTALATDSCDTRNSTTLTEMQNDNNTSRHKQRIHGFFHASSSSYTIRF